KLVKEFSVIDRYSKKQRGTTFLNRENDFMADCDKIFNIFCSDSKQRRKLKEEHQLKMSDDDFIFYKDQKNKRIFKCSEQVDSLQQLFAVYSKI
ncbi:hypothetical protein A3Q56_08753, partial [Intoshia linei]